MGWLDSFTGALDSVSGFVDTVGDAKNVWDSFSAGSDQVVGSPWPNIFPPIFSPTAGNAPSAPPPSIAATPGGFLSGTSGVLIVGAILLVLVLKR